MNNLKLPPLSGDNTTPTLPATRQLTIVGGAGAGKTRFMHKLVDLNLRHAFSLSALSALFPSQHTDSTPGSIDSLFDKFTNRLPFLRTDAENQLDKLIYMLIAEEFETLINIKQSNHQAEVEEGEVKFSKKFKDKKAKKGTPTRLDLLIATWQRIFPTNKILISRGMMMFATASGQDLISASQLSHSERAALYYCAAVLYAMPEAIIFVDSPSLFLHPSLMVTLWNAIEELRPDCRFIYDTVDVAFVNSRSQNICIWVKDFDAQNYTWNYEILSANENLDEMFLDLIGTRKPVLFIEGDLSHSIDSRLYPLLFPEATIKPLGSCDKVIETVRAFSGMKAVHNLESRGIVDRDRRTSTEVAYLRKRSIMVPNVAEVENLFLLERVIEAMAKARGRNAREVTDGVKKSILKQFTAHFDEQALQHVRHRVKRAIECKIDARFSCITAMETHLRMLPSLLNPRKQYNELRAKFQNMIRSRDYAGVLRVFNHKPMLGECGVAKALGFNNKDEYIRNVIEILKGHSACADTIRDAMLASFNSQEEK